LSSDTWPIVANSLLDKPLDIGKRRRRHDHLPDAGHVLAVVVAQQGKHPSDDLGEAVLWHGAGHCAEGLGLVGEGDALSHDAVEVCVFFAEVDIVVEAECRGGACGFERVAGRDGCVEGCQPGVETAMVALVGLGDGGGDGLDRGKDGEFLACGVPGQDLAKELKALGGQCAPGCAACSVERYPHGVWFVPLAPLRAVESIVPTIAVSLGFTFHGEAEPKARLLDYLRGKRLLLVLDNAEHLIQEPLSGVAGIAAEILKAAPGVKVLVTSRAGLNIQGEYRYPIEGMDYPDPAASAVLRIGPNPSPEGATRELDDAAQ